MTVKQYEFKYLDDNYDYILAHPEEYPDLVDFLSEYKYAEYHKGDWKAQLKGFINNWHLEGLLAKTYGLMPINPLFDLFELRAGNLDADLQIGGIKIEVKHFFTVTSAIDWLEHVKAWKKSGELKELERWYVNGRKRYISSKTKLADIVNVCTFNECTNKMNIYVMNLREDDPQWKLIDIIEKPRKYRY